MLQCTRLHTRRGRADSRYPTQLIRTRGLLSILLSQQLKAYSDISSARLQPNRRERRQTSGDAAKT